MKKWGIYEYSIILFFIILPIGASIIELQTFTENATIEIFLKWYVFFAIGLRLGSAGIKQILQPQFTAENIFKIKTKEVLPLVRELGFANISLAIIALLSLALPTFRIPAAIAGGIYFGLAGFMHLNKKKSSKEEVFAMISDLFIFIVLFIILVIEFSIVLY